MIVLRSGPKKRTRGRASRDEGANPFSETGRVQRWLAALVQGGPPRGVKAARGELPILWV